VAAHKAAEHDKDYRPQTAAEQRQSMAQYHRERAEAHRKKAYYHDNEAPFSTGAGYDAADKHRKAADAHDRAKSAHESGNPAEEYTARAADASAHAAKGDAEAEHESRIAEHGSKAGEHIKAHQFHQQTAKELRGESNRLRNSNPMSKKAEALKGAADLNEKTSEHHLKAASLHGQASDDLRRHGAPAGNQISEAAHSASDRAWRATSEHGRDRRDVLYHAEHGVLPPDEAGEREAKVKSTTFHTRYRKSMQPAGTKPKDPIMKKKTEEKDKPTIGDKRSPEERKKVAGQGPQPMEEEQPEAGSPEYHRDKALAHLAAAQAHANAHMSAKKLAETGDHDQKVKEAEESTQRVISKGGVDVHMGTDDEIVKYLEGAEIGTVSSALVDTGGRARLAGLRGERFEKASAETDPGDVAGGPVYQGEWDGPRGGDMRETIARAKVQLETVEDDPAGNHGQGGLAEWFRDSYGGQAEVNAPVGMGKIVRKSEEFTVVDDDDPYHKALRQADTRDGSAGMRMAYQGDGRENRKG
jgi:hypothetical protein